MSKSNIKFLILSSIVMFVLLLPGPLTLLVLYALFEMWSKDPS